MGDTHTRQTHLITATQVICGAVVSPTNLFVGDNLSLSPANGGRNKTGSVSCHPSIPITKLLTLDWPIKKKSEHSHKRARNYVRTSDVHWM